MESAKIKKQNLHSERNFFWGTLFILMLAQIGTSGDNGILIVATSSLIETLDASMDEIQLMNLIYALCAGSFMLIGGMIGIIVGWRKIFRIGVCLCALGEVIITLSPNIQVLTWGGRFTVGMGASLMIPAMFGLIVGVYHGKNRALAFGAIGASTGIAACLGPLIAGIFIDSLGWRFAFGFMAFFFVIILILSRIIPDIKLSQGKVKMDYLGAIISSVGLFILIIGISKISVWGFMKPINPPFTIVGLSPAIIMILLGILILFVLIPIEKKVENRNGAALIPQSYIKTPQVRDGVYLQFLIFFCFSGAGILISPYLQLVAGFSAKTTGLVMIFMAVPMVVFSIGIPKFFSNASPKNVSRLGILIASFSGIIMALSLSEDGVSWLIYFGLCLFGTGQGLVSSQASNIIAVAVNEREAQQSGGIQTAARDLGQAIGVALLGMMLLVSMTNITHDEVMKNDTISQETKKEVINLKTVNFMSNTKFIELVKPIAKSENELQELTQINSDVRKESTQNGLFLMSGIILLFLFGTNKIPHSLKK